MNRSGPEKPHGPQLASADQAHERHPHPAAPPYLTPPQVSRALHGAIPERTLRHRARWGRIKAWQNDFTCTWYIPRAEVYRIAAELQIEPDWLDLDDD